MNKYLEIGSDLSAAKFSVKLLDDWSLENAEALFKVSRDASSHLSSSESSSHKFSAASLDFSKLEKLDSSGAMQICKILQKLSISLENVEFISCPKSKEKLFKLVWNRFEHKPKSLVQSDGILEKVGKATTRIYQQVFLLFSFIGKACESAFQTALNPRLFRAKELFYQLEIVLVDAIFVVTLVTFLIGIVLAYLFASQIEQYGANIFIVDSVGLAICREISPILVAIVVAGRSGSAFTAQLGAMKLNEEIDAISVLGLNPMYVLVLPRILALMIAMPLLVILGDIVGVIGGMIVADHQLGVTYHSFMERMQSVLPIKSFIVGLVKAPIFALFIAIIGCRMGLEVKNSASSVGINTTSTVVQSIVSVILINAFFAILFVKFGY